VAARSRRSLVPSGRLDTTDHTVAGPGDVAATAPRPSGATAGGGDRRRRIAALDGLRGIAIVLVVAYHAAPDLVPGGFIGVSVFFTLSGFLITSKLAAEWARGRRLDLVRFWSGRVRRLLPAAVVTIAAVALVVDARGLLTRDFADGGIASLTFLRNWWQLGATDGYGALFERASPLDHFWSLAIEAQFYLVFPLALAAALAAPRGRRSPVAAALAAVSAATFVVPMVLGVGLERSYLGADTRSGEILAGAALALYGGSTAIRAFARSAAPIALAALVVTALVVPYGSDFFVLGFAPVTTASLVVMVGASIDGSVVTRVLSAPVLVWLGAVSYSIYLVHWPVLVLMERGTPARTAVALVVSLVLGAALHYAVEAPALRLAPLGRPTLLAGVVTTAVAVAVIGVARPGGERDVFAQIQAAADRLAVEQATAGSSTAAGPVATAAPPPTSSRVADPSGAVVAPPEAPTTDAGTTTATTTGLAPEPLPRLAFVGDSVALTLGFATTLAPERVTEFADADWSVEIGCGLARFDPSDPITPGCGDPLDLFTDMDPGSVDVAVVVSCQWELIDRRLPGESRARPITDPAFQDHLVAEYTRVVDRLTELGVGRVLWADCAPMSRVTVPVNLPDEFRASRAPERSEALDAVVARLAVDRPAIDVIDLERLVLGRLDDPVLRPDGSHFEFEVDVGIGSSFVELVRCVIRPCAAADH
jgi:peptidoglycan/LPS O-acetylase OafA/YrhL